MTGSDLATFELQGRTGKAGIEKTYDNHLRGRMEWIFGLLIQWVPDLRD